MKKIFFILFSWSCLAFAQNVKVQGRFLTDTMQLGQKVTFLLTVEFPYEMQVLMPDTTADFGKFDLVALKTSNSRLLNDTQIDSVFYELVSFSLDSIQSLRLPIKSFEGSDSTIHHSNTDSLILALPKVQQQLLSDIEQIPLYHRFNYQIWFLIALVGSLFFYVVYKVYFAKIKRLWHKATQRRRFKVYIKIHNQLLKDFQLEHNVDVLERIVGNWKGIMSDISDKPISTYTAKEINQIYKDQKLFDALQEIDKAIYSKKFSEALYVDIEIIYNKSKLEFFRQLKNKT